VIQAERRGVALFLALVALALIGALVSATLFRVQSDIRLAREGMARRSAEVAAERVLRVAVASTPSAALRSLAVGGALTSSDLTDGVNTTVTLIRVDSTLAWLTATASARSVRGAARAKLGASVFIPPVGAAPLQLLPGDTWAPAF
jgi:type II secretory pathway component PulK